MPRPGFDEYGGELGPDARIWPAYVKEAEAWDEEMVDGWNRSVPSISYYLTSGFNHAYRSLDVMLSEFFARALGSSVSKITLVDH